jgi:hypothetical protein
MSSKICLCNDKYECTYHRKRREGKDWRTRKSVFITKQEAKNKRNKQVDFQGELIPKR